ncbi:hypothetical protein KP509_16G078200 [Ceratopteris richardii]|uniref:Pentatricopeptide repeat-containing protein n=1 Tax=Ceratopteris richardii TaxID=49495 RepID=A0A8T2T5X1_CERRI|nr:hypothetical protein KP509_16G078200 [Ceratopteris richardii]
MQKEGLTPNAVTYACILKACGIIGAMEKGEQIHDEVANLGLLAENVVVLGTALVDMYAKCGAIEKAQEVFERAPLRNVASWSALIGGYVRHGKEERAFICFEQMQSEGIAPNAVTYACVLKACGTKGAIDRGIQIYDEISHQGLLKQSPMLGTCLIDMCAKCGFFNRAKQVLNEFLIQSAVFWNALIAEYVHQGKGNEAVDCYLQMQSRGFALDAITHICVLKACGITQAYKTEQMLDEIPTRNNVSWNAIISAYAQHGESEKAWTCFLNMQHEGFSPNIVSWNTLIMGYALEGLAEKAFAGPLQMQCVGIIPDPITFGLTPNAVTYACILKACGIIGAMEKGEQIHDEVANLGLLAENVVVLGTALVDMYAKCGAIEKAQEVFERAPLRNVASWSALIGGYVRHGKEERAFICFEQMQSEGIAPNAVTYACVLKACGTKGAIDRGIQIYDEISHQGLLKQSPMLGTCLIDMCAKCGFFNRAKQVLNEFLIQKCVHQGKGNEAVDCYLQMQSRGFALDAITHICVLKACGITQAYKTENVMLGNALIDMYAEWGMLLYAEQMLDEIPTRNNVSWNAIISAYAQHGESEKAWTCFLNMQHEGFSPNIVSWNTLIMGYALEGLAEKAFAAKCDVKGEGILFLGIFLEMALTQVCLKLDGQALI